MKKGFTLIELLTVIVIISVLAGLGLAQYGRVMERSRGAEAKDLLGQMRKAAAVYYQEHQTLNDAADPLLTALNIGPNPGQIPNVCRGSHYFYYLLILLNDSTGQFTATRCPGGGGANGKGTPTPYQGRWIIQMVTYPDGIDVWQSGPAGTDIPWL